MKSQLDTLIALTSCILRDAEMQCGLPRQEVSKDIERLVRCAKSRGLGFFTLDLPSLDEILLRAIETGSCRPTGALTSRRSKDDSRPRFLHALWSRVLDHNCRVVDDVCPTSLFFLRQVFCFWKKLEVPCSVARFNNSVKEYWKDEQTIEMAELQWNSDDPGETSKVSSFLTHFDRLAEELPLFREEDFRLSRSEWAETRGVARNLDIVAQVMCSIIGTFDLYSIETESSSLLRHGPGAVSDGKKNTYKYSFPHWPKKLEAEFPYTWCGSSDMSVGDYSEDEPPSKLIAVPKTAKGPRLIAAEPICHQWTQQLVASWLKERIKRSTLDAFIDFNRQDLSQDLVVKASKSRELATVDLKSASDLLSCAVVEKFFCRNESLLRAIHAVRTRTVYDGLVYRQRSFLRKFAAQGSALTFPIQTLVFLGFVFAACGVDGNNPLKKIKALRGKVRVYGDDIIIPRDSYDRLVLLLRAFGLKVNLTKSFSQGYFRESCGMDAYKGYNVTPIKPKHASWASPSERQAWVDTSNNLHKAGCWRTAHEMTRRLGWDTLPIVSAHLGAPGYLSFCGSNLDGQSIIWNKNLQREEIKLRLPYSSSRRVKVHEKAALLQYFVEDPDPLMKWSSGVPNHRSSVLRTVRVPVQHYAVVLSNGEHR